MKVYLIGSIHKEEEDVLEWREEASGLILRGGGSVINPMNWDFRDISDQRNTRGIITAMSRWAVQEADVLFGRIRASGSWGTPIEAYLAREIYRKPVFGFNASMDDPDLNPWVHDYFCFFMPTMEDAIDMMFSTMKIETQFGNHYHMGL